MTVTYLTTSILSAPSLSPGLWRTFGPNEAAHRSLHVRSSSKIQDPRELCHHSVRVMAFEAFKVLRKSDHRDGLSL